MFKKILVASEGSAGAARALSSAINLAKTHGADLHMICVEELPSFPASVDELIEEEADANHVFAAITTQAEAQAQALGIKLTTHVVVGHPVKTIAEFVEREAVDLLVVGFMGHSALYSRIIGSTTDRLVDLAPCAVLVVK